MDMNPRSFNLRELRILVVWSFILVGVGGPLFAKGFLTKADKRECHKQFEQKEYKPHPDMFIRMYKLIQKYGYPVQAHKVLTDDGYILTLYRIPGSQNPIKRRFFYAGNPDSTSTSGGGKPPVYLNHGLFANAHVWALQHGRKNLAFKLADEGFDVWLGNARGSKYSQLHRSLKVDDMAFWNFSFSEMGVYDVPAVIEYIRKVTKQEKIYYVGHSMGSTEFFIAMIKHPHLNDYIASAIMYAPVAFNSHATSIAKKMLAPVADELFLLMNDQLGGRFDAMEFLESNLGERLGEFCAYSENGCGLCAEVNTMIFGFDPLQMNYTLQSLFFSCFPDFVSTKTLLHYSQLMNTGTFQDFDYGSPWENEEHYGPGVVEPPAYDLSRITAPMVFVWSDHDNLATPRDVNITASQLKEGVLKENIRVDWKLWTHRDFINAIDADKFVYDRTVQIFKEKLYG